ncbi:MAG: AsmA family protein, partial [Pseudomonadota bacterium]
MIRKLLIGLLLLVLLAVVLALIAVAVVDPDDYRDEIAQRASETLGREVRLDGPMSLSLFPWLALEIEDVVVGNPPVLADAPPLARIGKAVASVRVMPLLGGQMETGDITLSEAQLTLIAGPNDQSNLDGLLEEADPTADTPPLNLTGLNLGTITLEQVDLVQLDLLSDARTTLAIDRMVLDAFAPERPVGFSLQASLSDDSGELLVFDELTGELRVALDASEVAISDLLADYRLPGGDMLGQATGQARIQRGDALSLA